MSDLEKKSVYLAQFCATAPNIQDPLQAGHGDHPACWSLSQDARAVSGDLVGAPSGLCRPTKMKWQGDVSQKDDSQQTSNSLVLHQNVHIRDWSVPVVSLRISPLQLSVKSAKFQSG
jgi:hypothetical protein